MVFDLQGIPGTQMTSVFEGQAPKTRPKFQSKQGSVGFQVKYEIRYISLSYWKILEGHVTNMYSDD